MPEPPPDFALPNINPIPRKMPLNPSSGKRRPPPGVHRMKGTVNKVTRDLKQGLLAAAESLGEDGNGKNGMLGYLRYVGVHHPKAFCHLLGKLLPLQVNADATVQTIGQVNVISVPVGHFLSLEDIERERGAQIKQLAPAEPIIEPPAIEPAPAKTWHYTPLPPRHRAG